MGAAIMRRATTAILISASGAPDRFKNLRLALRRSKVARAVIIKIDGAVGVPVNNARGQWEWDHNRFLCKWRSRQMAVEQCAQNAGMDGERLCRTLDFLLPRT